MKPVLIIPVVIILSIIQTSCSNKPTKKQAQDYLCNYISDASQVQVAIDSFRYSTAEFFNYLKYRLNRDSPQAAKEALNNILIRYDVYLGRYSKILADWQKVPVLHDKTELREKFFKAFSDMEAFQKTDFRLLMVSSRDSLGQLSDERIEQVRSKYNALTAEADSAMELQQEFCKEFEIDPADYDKLTTTCVRRS